LRNAAVVLVTLLVAACAGRSALTTEPVGAQAPFSSNSKHRDSGPYNRITHVVVIIQENRSFESFFAGYPGADAPTYGCAELPSRRPASARPEPASSPCPSGDQTIELQSVKFQNESDLPHNFEPAIIAWDNGKMDGFTLEGGSGYTTAPYAYIERSQVATYWSIARQYVLADRMFPTEFGPSWTAHLTLVAGTDNVGANLALADFADGKNSCEAPAGTKTTTVNAYRVLQRAAGPYPCLDQFNTMAQLLDGAGISWRYYAARKFKTFIWSPFAAIKYVYDGPDWNNDVVVPQTQVLQDAADGKLASVSWVTPSKKDSDHPGTFSDTGPSWIASVVNSVGESAYWDSSAIIVLWDDWGGVYDDAPPPQLDFRGLGLRVPCLIISPYAKRGAVVHTSYEFGSILKFIREAFGLPPLGPASQGYTDSRANSLSDSFDFNKPPRRFKPIRSKYSMQHFLHEPPSQEPADDY
jgi:phospholipase C